MIDIETQKRIYQVGLMLRRKPIPFILEFAGKEWGIEKSQTYEYIRLAREEWKKYFLNLKNSGMSYHISQLRDIKDEAYNRKFVIGRGDNKQVITIPDLGLIFEITKEEAKLMGIYPTETHKLEIEGSLEVNSELDKKLAQLDVKDLIKLSKLNIKVNADK
jgi:hypothetical protein